MGADRIIATRSQVPVGEGKNVMHTRSELKANTNVYFLPERDITQKDREEIVAYFNSAFSDRIVGIADLIKRVRRPHALAHLTMLSRNVSGMSFSYNNGLLIQSINTLQDRAREIFSNDSVSSIGMEGVHALAYIKFITPTLFPQKMLDKDPEALTRAARRTMRNSGEFLERIFSVKILFPKASMEDMLRGSFTHKGREADDFVYGMSLSRLERNRAWKRPGIISTDIPYTKEFAKTAAMLRLLFPERWDNEAQLTEEDWQHMHTGLAGFREAEDYEFFVEQAFYMSVLAAKKAELTKDGQVDLEFSQELEESRVQKPPTRRFRDNAR